MLRRPSIARPPRPHQHVALSPFLLFLATGAKLPKDSRLVREDWVVPVVSVSPKLRDELSLPVSTLKPSQFLFSGPFKLTNEELGQNG